MATDERKIILEIDLDVAKSAKSVAELKDLQKSLNKELQNATIGTAEYKKLEVQSVLVTKELKNLTATTATLSKEIGVESKSLRDLQNEYNKYAKALRETAPGNKVLGLSFEDAQKKALGLKTEIKDFEAKLGNFQSNVGNYGSALKDASQQSGLFAQQTQLITQAQSGLSAGLNLAKVGFTTLKGAIISTGFGALVVLVGLLITYLKETEAGGDSLAKVMRGLGNVLQGIINFIIKVGEVVFNVAGKYIPGLISIVETLINISLKPWIKAIDLVASGLSAIGLDKASNAVSGFSKDVAGATTSVKNWVSGLYEAGSAIAELEDNLEDLQIKNKILNAQLQTTVEQNIKALKNRTLTYSESQKIIEAASAAETEILKNNTKEIDAQLEIQRKIFIENAQDKGKAQETFTKLLSGEIDAIEAIARLDGNNKTDRINDIADLIVKQEDANRQFILLDTKLNNERDKLEEERKSKQLKADQERLKSAQDEFAYQQILSQKRIALIDYELKYSKLSIDERYELVKRRNDELVSLEEESLKVQLKDKTLSEVQRQTLTEQSNQKIYQLNVQLEQDNKALQQQALDDQKRFNDAAIALDISRSDRIIEQNKRLIADKKTTDEQRIELIDQNLELEIEKEQYKGDALLANENLLADERTKIYEEFQDKQRKLTEQAEYDKQQALLKTKQINDAVEIAKLNAVKGTFAAAASLFSQQSTGYKALASAQALINTYQAGTAALASGSEVNPVFGIVSAGVAIANGLASVAKINGVHFERGGIASKQGVIGGNLHSNGGTKFYGTDGSVFEAERGELLTVVNRWDTKRLSALSNANSVHGKPFFQYGGIASKSYLQDGGIALRQASQPAIDTLEQTNQIIRIIQSTPAPVVGVKDIITSADKRTRVRVMANLTK